MTIENVVVPGTTTEPGTTAATPATAAIDAVEATLLTPATAADGTTTKSEEDKSGGDKGATGGTEGDKKTDDTKAPSAPEKYEDFKMPDGVTLDKEISGEFQVLAKELNLPQDKAQAVVDLATKMQAKHFDAVVQTVKGWEATTRADKEVGGDKLGENMATAQKAIAAYGTPELKELLANSGLGNHPEVVRAFYRVGKALEQDKVVVGGKGQPAETDIAKRLYPNLS